MVFLNVSGRDTAAFLRAGAFFRGAVPAPHAADFLAEGFFALFF
jgi:hypothetical protein